jgi:hypothetical protein
VGAIGTIGGTFLVPGVSLNNRLYTKDAIGKAVKRMTERIADPAGLPIVMLTHHGAGDDSTRISARVTAVAQQDDGSATWEGALPDTKAGREIAALTEPDSTGRRALETVSIRGWWLGQVLTTSVDGQQVETADDLEIDGIDFTRSPGVTAARIATTTKLAERAGQRTPITESAPETHVETSQAPPPKPSFADAGHQSDGLERLPIDSVEQVRDAWCSINQSVVQERYTPRQVQLIRGRIKTAAEKHQLTLTDAHTLQEALDGLRSAAEAYISVSAYQDQTDVDVRAFGVANHDIAAAATQIGAAATAALTVLDPDGDGDLDLPGDSGARCKSCDEPVPQGSIFCPSCGGPVVAGESETTTKEPTVADTNTDTGKDAPKPGTTEGAGTSKESTEAPADTSTTGTDAAGSDGGEKPADAPTGTTSTDLSQEQIDAIAAKIADQIQSKVGQPSAPAETTTPATTTTEASAEAKPEVPPQLTAEDLSKAVAAAVAEGVNGLRKQLVEDLGPSRKGLLREAADAQKAAAGDGRDLSKLSSTDLLKVASQAWDSVLGPINPT